MAKKPSSKNGHFLSELLSNAESGVTASEKKQVETVTDYFRELFRKDSQKEVEDVKPVEMRDGLFQGGV